ncbi:HAUS augmin-like complex subunit 1 [Corticium candelabrum]|uniref:HAUS augmin-like complex subunit 1 n=1 Tax=Corticium candelabrum TaxID=121492 RepID=UPI002E25DD11|nr:HAUS augmin-like complex subunit 1 [Corticium candelabrum]
MQIMEERHSAVDDWLRRISTNDTRVPAYEICMRTMDMLSELSTACEKQQTRVKLILDDMKQKENEYKSEGLVRNKQQKLPVCNC